MKVITTLSLLGMGGMFFLAREISMTLRRSATVEALGAGQGIAYIDQKAYLYGDREVGMIRVIDIDKADELEGFALLGNVTKGLAVTSSQKDNAHFMNITW